MVVRLNIALPRVMPATVLAPLDSYAAMDRRVSHLRVALTIGSATFAIRCPCSAASRPTVRGGHRSARRRFDRGLRPAAARVVTAATPRRANAYGAVAGSDKYRPANACGISLSKLTCRLTRTPVMFSTE